MSILSRLNARIAIILVCCFQAVEWRNALADDNLDEVLVKCHMTNYVNIWEHKVIDDWSKRDTSVDIKNFEKFQFIVANKKIKFEQTSFFRGHEYDYSKFKRYKDGFIDIVGVRYEPGFAVDAIAFWHGTYQESGAFMFSRTNSLSNLSFSAICTKVNFGQ